MVKSDEQVNSEVVRYYNRTRKEYRIIWKSNKSYGIHFGYYNQQAQNHETAILEINKQMAQLVKISKNDTVLDAGSGIGGSCIYLAKHYGCRTIGVNITPWQVEKAKALSVKNGVEKLTDFRLESFDSTSLNDASVTVFWGHEAIVHAKDKQVLLDEAYRVLRPGGRLIIAEYMLKEKELSSKEKELVNRWLDGWAMPSLLKKSEYKNKARRSGFKRIQFNDWTEPVMLSFNRLEKYAKLSRKSSKFLKAIRFVNDSELKNLDATEAQMQSLKEKVWTYQVMTAMKP